MYNIYCDESCHLPNDGINLMVLGGISCPDEHKRKVYNDIRLIKRKHGLNSKTEVKWTKVSSTKIDLYIELIHYFFKTEYLEFRAVVAKDLQYLDHEKYNNSDHDLWYWKMYFYLLDWFIKPGGEYNIFIDVKDTKGGPKTRKLHDVLSNHKYDFRKDMIKQIHQISSNRSDILQLTDLLIGSLSYYHRGLYLKGSENKTQLVNTVISHVGDKIEGTYPSEQKFNVFVWSPQKG